MKDQSLKPLTRDHAGVYIPPPLIYVSIFFSSIFIQNLLPIHLPWVDVQMTLIGGAVFIAFGLTMIVPSLIQFAKSRNSLITIKAATSLQTTGIYAISRNPMYLGLMMIYIGVAFLKGNVWTFLFVPIVMMVVQFYVIRNEENYLAGKFPGEFGEYVKRVRRWI